MVNLFIEMKKTFFFIALFCFWSLLSLAQLASIEGRVISSGAGESWVNVYLENTDRATTTDSLGNFRLDSLLPGQYKLVTSHLNFEPSVKEVTLVAGQTLTVNIDLSALAKTGTLKDVVISGT